MVEHLVLMSHAGARCVLCIYFPSTPLARHTPGWSSFEQIRERELVCDLLGPSRTGQQGQQSPCDVGECLNLCVKHEAA